MFSIYFSYRISRLLIIIIRASHNNIAVTKRPLTGTTPRFRFSRPTIFDAHCPAMASRSAARTGNLLRKGFFPTTPNWVRDQATV
jgi:hypothetical protein